MNSARSMAVAALVFLGTASVTHAVRSMVKLDNDGVTFKIFNVNDGALYEVTYTTGGVRCHITIDDQMELQRFIVGDEMYPITYGTYPTIQAPVAAPSGWGGRQYVPWACDDCEDTYNVLCTPLQNGFRTSLYDEACSTYVGLRDPDDLLSETATAALATFCDSFLCDRGSLPNAEDVCEGQCESGDPNCVRALEVTLEWEGFGNLDLWIREPTDDETSTWSSPTNIADLGRFESTGDWSYFDVVYGPSPDETENLGPRSVTYYLESGLSPNDAVGNYEIWAQISQSAAPISWKLTAEVNGEQALSEAGMFEKTFEVWDSVGDRPAPESEHFIVTLDEYIDNDCSNTGS